MPQSHDALCPWCQTEIVWDPEIGPEDTCPHCFNELGDYRSLNFTVKPSDRQITFDEEEDYDLSEDDMDLLDDYEEGVQRVLDNQEEAPECAACHSLMLFSGTQNGPQGFVPFMHGSLKQPLLKASFSSQVYVCPSCFKVEYSLAEKDRLALIELLRSNGGPSS